MLPYEKVPVFAEGSSSFADYEQFVRLWNQTTAAEPAKRASTLILHMDTFARPVCLGAGGDTFMQGENAEAILKISRDYLRPDAWDRAYLQVTKFIHY